MEIQNYLKKASIDNLNCCKIFLNSLCNISADNTELTTWFKKLCSLLTNFMEILNKYIKNSDPAPAESHKISFLLYLHRIISLLSFIIDVFVTENDAGKTWQINVARNFFTKQMIWCFDGLNNIFSEHFSDTCSESFIKWMDLALQKLQEVDAESDQCENSLNQVKLVMDELLCRAISISQLSLSNDQKKIQGSCQAVLESLESLTTEILKPEKNKSMCKIFVDYCEGQLYTLERRINTAILLLSLKVFSQYLVPINQLYNFSLINTNNEEEMEELVDQFDTHVDHMLLIGFFAVGCSADITKITKLKSCLANLEALEVEFVPALKTLKKDSSDVNVQFVKILKDFWISQALVLQKYVYYIIDPSAFLQVIQKQINYEIETIESHLETKGRLSTDDISALLSQTEVLIDFIPTFAHDEQYQKSDDLMKHFVSLKMILHETRSAKNVLLCKMEDHKQNGQRVLKRCKILGATVKKLLMCIINIESNECELEHNQQLNENKFLNHVLNLKGFDVLKNQSILNPIASQSLFESLQNGRNLSKTNNGYSNLMNKSHRMNFSTCNNKGNKSVDLQITDILNSILDLSTAVLK